MLRLYRDLRFAVRQLQKSPGFTASAILCMALGIGANSAAFSTLNSLLLQLPPVEKPDRLVRIFISYKDGIQFGNLSYPDYVDLRERNSVFADLITETPKPLHLSHGDRSERIWGSIVSGNYFSGLGVRMALGRGFLPEEDRTPGTRPVVVVSHDLWQRLFGGDAGRLGSSLLLNGHAFTVIGVTPRNFRGPNVGLEPQLWAPLMMRQQLIPGSAGLEARGNHWMLFTIGRLKPGVTLQQAAAECGAILAQLANEYPGLYIGQSLKLYPESSATLHPMVRKPLTTGMGAMFGVVAILLLLACANVAGLVLARSATRRKEIGIRLALGASHGQLLGQLLTESILLAIIAGGIGLGFCIFLTGFIQWLQPAMDMPLSFNVEPDHSVVGFALLISVLSGILCGFAPALQASRPDLVTVLKETGSSESTKTLRFRNLLVVGQLALSMMLLMAAGLVIRSLQNVNKINPGFDPEHQAVASMDLELQGYDWAAVVKFVRELGDRLRLLPGVQAVGFGQIIPLALSAQQTGFKPEGYILPPDQSNPGTEYNIVDPGYFAAMGIRILQGRVFSDRDDRRAPPVVIVNETVARHFWPDQNPIGKRAWVGMGGGGFEVVGVVPDGKYLTLGEAPKPCIYLSFYQIHTGELNVHVRTSADPDSLLEPIRRQAAALDPTLPVFNLKTMSDHLDFALLPARLVAGAVSAFALMALLLAAVGLYGVMAYSVNQRVREIGIRIALGATRQDVLKLVVGRGMLLNIMGLAIGTAAGFLLTPAMYGLLYGVSTTDPVSHAGAVIVLGATGLLASYLPALKATRVDAINTLRAE